MPENQRTSAEVEHWTFWEAFRFPSAAVSLALCMRFQPDWKTLLVAAATWWGLRRYSQFAGLFGLALWAFFLGARAPVPSAPSLRMAAVFMLIGPVRSKSRGWAGFFVAAVFFAVAAVEPDAGVSFFSGSLLFGVVIVLVGLAVFWQWKKPPFFFPSDRLRVCAVLWGASVAGALRISGCVEASVLAAFPLAALHGISTLKRFRPRWEFPMKYSILFAAHAAGLLEWLFGAFTRR